MRRATVAGLFCLLLAAPPRDAGTQTPRPSRKAVALDCRLCHTGATPTKANPALAQCPRLLIVDYHTAADAPATMKLGTSTGRYAPVAFSHRGHAEMAAMGGGCEGCHHYDQARPIQKCDGCHSPTRLRADLTRPDRKAAMHRQCLDCHREWNPKVTCVSCHSEGGGGVKVAGPEKPVAPTRLVYQTTAAAGRTVTFFHNEHVQRFGLDCADCHQGTTCGSCHGVAATAAAPPPAPAARTEAEAHVRCAGCHQTDRCTTCHSDRGPRTAGFDHRARTGWALNRFHASLPCGRCHGEAGTFEKVSADCEACHAGWQQRFRHGKTGLELDETHAGADCASCHPDQTFRAAPACKDCHEDMSYPAARPGKAVIPPGGRR
jgi:hypothetical protein